MYVIMYSNKNHKKFFVLREKHQPLLKQSVL